MMTISEVQRISGVSARTLRYYDRIGLLPPVAVTDAGYRLYDSASLERLQQILLFRELQFPLKEIRRILDHPNFDRERALEQQIELLTLRKQHLEDLLALARQIQSTGVNAMDFSAFDTAQMDEYAARAQAAWGDTAAYRQFERKQAARDPATGQALAAAMMKLFAGFGALHTDDPTGEAAQAQAAALRAFITEHYYDCTLEIFAGLGQMYAANGEFRENIDRAGGPGTARFAAEAIRIYCASARDSDRT